MQLNGTLLQKVNREVFTAVRYISHTQRIAWMHVYTYTHAMRVCTPVRLMIPVQGSD